MEERPSAKGKVVGSSPIEADYQVGELIQPVFLYYKSIEDNNLISLFSS